MCNSFDYQPKSESAAVNSLCFFPHFFYFVRIFCGRTGQVGQNKKKDGFSSRSTSAAPPCVNDERGCRSIGPLWSDSPDTGLRASTRTPSRAGTISRFRCVLECVNCQKKKKKKKAWDWEHWRDWDWGNGTQNI